MQKCKEYGGVALEYLIVTIFASLLSIILLSIVSDLTQKKITELAQKFDFEMSEFEINPFKL